MKHDANPTFIEVDGKENDREEIAFHYCCCFVIHADCSCLNCKRAENLTIVWAQWPPADYLQESSKGFTEKTGIHVEVVQIPWPSFQDQIFTAFVGKSNRYEIVIGDGQ